MADDKDTKPTTAKAADAKPAKDPDTDGQPSFSDPEAASEKAPKPAEDTPAKPKGDASPDDVTPSDSGPNYISTAGLGPVEKARVEGTPVTGVTGG